MRGEGKKMSGLGLGVWFWGFGFGGGGEEREGAYAARFYVWIVEESVAYGQYG